MNSKAGKTYITVYWITLERFNLKSAEACLLFLIKGLSRNKDCYASKNFLAKRLNISEATIYSLIRKLIKKGLLEKHGFSEYGTMHLATTEKFNEHLKLLKEIVA